MIRSTVIFTIFMSFGLLYAMPAAAQSQQEGPWFFKMDAGGIHQDDANLKDSTGGFSVDRWFISGGVDYRWSQRDSIGVSIGGGQSNYDFDELTGFGGGEPWNKIDDFRLSITGRFGVGETATVILIPTVRFNGEGSASSSDSDTVGLFAAMTWQVNSGLNIGPGIGIFSRLEDGVKFFPILAIEWDISDRWNLSTGRGLAASQGPGLTLTYELNQDWSFGLTGRYEDIEFRLDDEGPAAGGVGRDQSMPMVFRADLTPNEKLNLTVFAGLEFGGKLKLKNSLDIIVDESKYDPAAIFGVAFEYRF